MKINSVCALVALGLSLVANAARADSPACAELAQRYTKAAAVKRPVVDAEKVADALTELLTTDPSCRAAPTKAYDLLVAAWKDVLAPYDKKLERAAIEAELKRISAVSRVLGAILRFEHTGLSGHVSLAMGKIQESTAHFLRKQGDRAAPQQPGADSLYGSAAVNPWRTWILRAKASYERALESLTDPRDKASFDSAQRSLDSLRRNYLPRRAEPRPEPKAKPEAEAAPTAEPTPVAQTTPARRRPAQQPDVYLFTTSWCPHCVTTRRWLNENGVKFREYDVETDPEAKERQGKLARQAGVKPESMRSIPTVFVGSEYSTGFKPAWLAERLGP
ncbi:MAG: glutaredoxin family protein [Myxococcota bacterium]